jgi:hypothetical protein
MMPQFSPEDTLTLCRLKYIIGARNTSPNNADCVKIFLFDPEFKGKNKYLTFAAPQQAATGKHFKIYEGVIFGFFAISDSSKDRKSIEKTLISEYGEGSSFIFPHIGKDLNRTCIFVVYRDIRKQIYCLKRWVAFDDGGSVISCSEKVFYK